MTIKGIYSRAVIGKIFLGRRAMVLSAGHILWSRLGCFVDALRGVRVTDEPRWELSDTLSVGLSLRSLHVCQHSVSLRIVAITLCETFNDRAQGMTRICIFQPTIIACYSSLQLTLFLLGLSRV